MSSEIGREKKKSKYDQIDKCNEMKVNKKSTKVRVGDSQLTS